MWTLAVDYSLPLEEMIAAVGFEEVSESITAEHFPVRGVGKAEATTLLVDFDHAVCTREVLRAMEERGLRPAELTEALALVAEYPGILGYSTVVVLGSSWTDEEYKNWVPILMYGYGKYYLSVRGCRSDSTWGSGMVCSYRFLAVEREQ